MQQLFLYIDAHILLLRDIESAGETNTQAFTVCFYDLCLSRLGFEHPTFRLRYRNINHTKLRHSCILNKLSILLKYYCLSKVYMRSFEDAFHSPLFVKGTPKQEFFVQ